MAGATAFVLSSGLVTVFALSSGLVLVFALSSGLFTGPFVSTGAGEVDFFSGSFAGWAAVFVLLGGAPPGGYHDMIIQIYFDLKLI